MAAVQTLSGRVSRAIDFLNLTTVWMALARPFSWTSARLTGLEVESFTFPADETFEFVINTEVISAPFLASATYTAASLVAYLQTLLPLSIPPTAISATADKRLRITAPVPLTGQATVEIVTGSAVLGFVDGEISVAAVLESPPNEPPSPDPLTRHLIEPFGWEKVNQLTKSLVVPDPATAAEMIGTIRANTFNLSIPPNEQLSFYVDDNPTLISVTFPAGVAVSINAIVSFINAAALLVSPDYGTVASVDGSSLPPALRLRSPTTGALSKIETVVGNAALGIPNTTTVNGYAGGPVRFRNDQFRLVDVADAYDEGAALVFIQARFPYDQIPTLPFSQVGVFTGVVPKPGYTSRTYLVFSEIEDFGILEFIDTRPLTPRGADQAETVSLVLEF